VRVSKRCCLQIGLLVFASTALAIDVQAAGFSQANVKGSYSFLVNKWIADVSLQQFAEVGVLTFDGAGHVTGSATAVGDGASQTGALGGTYTVNSNGTGVVNLTTIFLGGTDRVAFVLNSTAGGVAHGVQFMTANDSNNEVVSGTAVLQSTAPAAYSAATLSGRFTFQVNAWSADMNFDEQGCIGLLTSDGKGNITGSTTCVDLGVLSKGTFTGVYTVNPDGTCSMSLVNSDGSTPVLACALNTVGAAGASDLQLVVTNPGPSGSDNSTNYEVTGTAVKQGAP